MIDELENLRENESQQQITSSIVGGLAYEDQIRRIQKEILFSGQN